MDKDDRGVMCPGGSVGGGVGIGERSERRWASSRINHFFFFFKKTVFSNVFSQTMTKIFKDLATAECKFSALVSFFKSYQQCTCISELQLFLMELNSGVAGH